MRNFRIGRLKGRFVVTWREQDGRRRRYRLDACTLAEAEREAIDVIRREIAPPKGMTVSEIWESYQADLGTRPTAKTISYTGKAVLPHFGELRPDQITTEHCRAYVAKRRAQGRAQGTIWTELGHLRSCLRWAAKTRLIERAPFIERPEKPAPKDRFLTRDEIHRLLDAAAEPHVRLAILLMLSTAARVSAILELTWDRVDLDRGQINLRTESEGPRKGRAVVPINEGLRAALVVARESALSDYVVEWAGGPVKSIRKGFQTAVRNAGLKNVSPHVLRHSAARLMAENGIPMAQISQFLGHSNTAVTERVYARFSPQYLQEAAEILDFGGQNKLKLVQ